MSKDWKLHADSNNSVKVESKKKMTKLTYPFLSYPVVSYRFVSYHILSDPILCYCFLCLKEAQVRKSSWDVYLRTYAWRFLCINPMNVPVLDCTFARIYLVNEGTYAFFEIKQHKTIYLKVFWHFNNGNWSFFARLIIIKPIQVQFQWFIIDKLIIFENW